MAHNEIYKATIELNARDAESTLKKLDNEIKTATAERDRLLASADKTDRKRATDMQKRIDQLNKKMVQAQREVNGYNTILQNCSRQGYRELKDAVSQMQKRLRSGDVKKHSEEWEWLTKRIRECKREMQTYTEATQVQTTAWQRFTKFLNDSWGGVTVLMSSIAGLSFTIRKAVSAYSDMQQEMANVRKYTGQSAEEVERMNEDFKQMDTRTAREELNQLAGAAGRLGITETAMVEEFVDGADKIKVALGDDLGEGAVDTIGKLAIAFGEDKTKGLRGAMLATGSALNELVQSSPAQAQPIIEFTSKLSGVGQQAHMSQAQIMGFAAAVDQNNQEMATSSTVMNQLITKMYQDPARFAKMAGMEVKGFADLVKKDMNGALVEWLQHVNKLGDMSVLAGKFDELKMDGTRAVGVLATLAGHIDQVTEAQRIATQAYEEGTSVTKEFNIQNETVQAQTEKAKKRFRDLTIELGEKLLPVVRYTISSGSMMVKGLSTLIDFVGKYKVTLAMLMATIVALNAKRLYGIALSKLEVLWNKRVASSIMGIGKAFKTNPWGIAVTAVVAFVGILVDASRRLKAHQKEVSAVEKAHKAASKQYDDEASKVQLLSRMVHDSTLSYEKRKEKLDELKEIVPGYLADLDKEKGLINDNTDALTDYLTQLERSIKMRAVEDELAEAYKKRRTLGKEKDSAEDEVRSAGFSLAAAQYSANADANRLGTKGMQQLSKGMDLATKNAQTRVGVARRELEKVNTQIDKNEESIKELEDEIRNIDNSLTSSSSNGKANENKTAEEQEKSRKFWEEELKSRKEAYENTKKGSKEAAAAYKLVLEAERELAKFNDYKTPSQRTKEEKEEETERKRRLKERADMAKAERDEELADEMYCYMKGQSSYTDYMEQRRQVTLKYYDELQRIYKDDYNELAKVLRERAELEYKYGQEDAKKSDETLVSERLERERNLRRQFEDEANREMYHNEDALNEALFKSDMQYLRQKQKLYQNGSKEWEQLEMQIQQKNKQHQFENEQNYIQRLSQYREEAGRMDYEKLKEVELAGAKFLFEQLIAMGKATEDEYNEVVEEIKRKYKELEADQTASQDVRQRASKGLDTAKKAAGAQDVYAGNDLATGTFGIFQAVEQQKLINEQLKELYGKDYENNEEYQEAKRQLNAQTMQSIVAAAQAAYSSISTMMSAASSLAQANSDLEVAKINANYDKQIEAAGKNSKKREGLEKERDEKIAKAKTKANQKAMAMEIAQAIAQTAMGAISAYSSTMAGAPYPANLVLAPISAGIALAAGAMQIATIKKQHQAEAMGYYEGGYTGGRRYHREAGVVHEGEFVANHQAVNNRQLAPMFNLIDQAQRQNRVASLRAEDVTNVMGGPASTVVAPVVNVQTDNSELAGTMDETRNVLDRLATQLELGIGVDIPIPGENGMYHRMKQYENLLNNK